MKTDYTYFNGKIYSSEAPKEILDYIIKTERKENPIKVNGNSIDRLSLPRGTPEEIRKILSDKNVLPPEIRESCGEFEKDKVSIYDPLGLKHIKRSSYREFPSSEFCFEGKTTAKVDNPFPMN